MRAKIESELIELVYRELPDLETGFSAETNLVQAGINSMEFIKLVVLIENEFHIFFEDEDLSLEYYPTVNELVSYIEQKIYQENIH